MISTESKTLGECFPTTKEGWDKLIQEKFEESKNYSNCESPIEEDFLHCFYKVKAENVSINGQEICQTRLGNFRLDFVITTGSRKIAIECDGKDYHDKERDKLRDEAILETGFVDTIYRIPGKGLWFFTNDVLDLLRIVEPTLFDERGNQLLDAILNDDSKREDSWNEDFYVRALSQRKLAEDGECELGEIEYKSPQYISLKWTPAKNRLQTK
jgi:very-short-patch-repair endonuclease